MVTRRQCFPVFAVHAHPPAFKRMREMRLYHLMVAEKKTCIVQRYWTRLLSDRSLQDAFGNLRNFLEGLRYFLLSAGNGLCKLSLCDVLGQRRLGCGFSLNQR